MPVRPITVFQDPPSQPRGVRIRIHFFPDDIPKEVGGQGGSKLWVFAHQRSESEGPERSPGDALGTEVFEDLEDRILDTERLGIEHEVGVLRFLENAVPTRESGDFTCGGLGVKPLGVAGLAGSVVGLHVDFPEILAEDAAGDRGRHRAG